MSTPLRSQAGFPRAQKAFKPTKKKCLNCPKFVILDNPRTSTRKKFCCDQCRKEFHHFGGAYGSLKQKIEELVRDEVKRVLPTLLAEQRAKHPL